MRCIPFVNEPGDVPSRLARDSLIAALDVVDNTLGIICGCEFTKAGEGRTLPFETAMAERLLTGWGNGTQRAARAAIKGLAARKGELSEQEITAILTIMNGEIERGFVRPMNQYIPGLITNGYNKAKADVARKLKQQLTFSVLDSESIRWLRDHHLYWIGTYYNKHVSGRIAETIAEGMAEGLGRERIGDRLKEFFDNYPGVRIQPESYWRGLAANGMNRSRNFGLISGYQEVGVTQLRIVAVRDERTSDICLELDGRVIPVARAAQQRDALMAAEDPEDVKTIAPWLRAEQLADKPTDVLMNMGIGLPPYHFHCRTTVVEA
jgi:hypothetical protein